ncbi:hypothetical protein ABE493_18360 [Stenotrophomonas terrae]|uniref:hypothetical protein n=1 Tax=Stenotrophomonas terrae TaxID=405446 RepID=UPI00320AC749
MKSIENLQEPRKDLSNQPLTLRSIEFPDLNELLDQCLKRTEEPKFRKLERWSLIAGIGGAGIGLLLGATLPGVAGSLALYGGLISEVAGFAVHAALVVKRDWRQFRHARANHAEELEAGYQQQQEIIDLMRAFPFEQRKRRLLYVQNRRAMMHERLGLFTGGIERLGVVPLLLALYLQFKDWRLGDWKALNNITFIQALLALALMLAYAIFWHLIFLRTRVQTYELLLTEANNQHKESNDEQKPTQFLRLK